MDRKIEGLRLRLREIANIESAGTLLYWDQSTYIPQGGAQARARQMATLARLAHERWVDPSLGRLIDELRPLEETLRYESLPRGSSAPSMRRAMPCTSRASRRSSRKRPWLRGPQHTHGHLVEGH